MDWWAVGLVCHANEVLSGRYSGRFPLTQGERRGNAYRFLKPDPHGKGKDGWEQVADSPDQWLELLSTDGVMGLRYHLAGVEDWRDVWLGRGNQMCFEAVRPGRDSDIWTFNTKAEHSRVQNVATRKLIRIPGGFWGKLLGPIFDLDEPVPKGEPFPMLVLRRIAEVVFLPVTLLVVIIRLVTWIYEAISNKWSPPLVWVHYCHLQPKQKTSSLPDPDPDPKAASAALRAALEDALAFTGKNGTGFEDAFEKALKSLQGDRTAQQEALKKMALKLPPTTTRNGVALIAACRHAWVFGGMASWNDILFHSKEVEAEYDRVTDALYRAIMVSALAAANSGFAAPSPDGTKA